MQLEAPGSPCGPCLALLRQGEAEVEAEGRLALSIPLPKPRVPDVRCELCPCGLPRLVEDGLKAAGGRPNLRPREPLSKSRAFSDLMLRVLPRKDIHWLPREAEARFHKGLEKVEALAPEKRQGGKSSTLGLPSRACSAKPASRALPGCQETYLCLNNRVVCFMSQRLAS